MQRWLAGGAELARPEFVHLLDAQLEFCFLAHPATAGRTA
jgi:hypothetical protein